MMTDMKSRRIKYLTALMVTGSLLSWGASNGQANEADARFEKQYLIEKLRPITGDTFRTLNLTLQFKINSSNLTQLGRQQLHSLFEAMQSDELKGLSYKIYGHTDASGASSHNMGLSESRAQSVYHYLVDGKNMNKELFLEVAGFGEEKLLSHLPARSSRQRRVEIVSVHQTVDTPPSPKQTSGWKSIE